MSLRTELFTYWKSKTTITNTFGTGDACRIYPAVAPSGAVYPYAVHHVISADHEHDMAAAAGLAAVVLQIDVYDDDVVDLETAATTFRTVMDGLTHTTLTSISVNGCHLQNERTGLDLVDGQEDGTHVHQLDFMIWHDESVPTFPAS